MKYHHQATTIPEKTAKVADKAFKKGNVYVEMRKAIGTIYADETFGHLFSYKGRRAESPGNLALIIVMQYREKLSDREAAESVGTRIDWKYLLGLEIEEEGIRYQQLNAFRERVVAGGEEELLLNTILERLEREGLLKGKKNQRTDATYIITAARRLNRLELVWEALSKMIEALAWRAPKWLQEQISQEWVKAYARPIGWRRFPEKEKEQEEIAVKMGQDGLALWERFIASPFYEEWHTLEEVAVWREIWVQQYYIEEGQIKWRKKGELPPASKAIATPHDVQARYSEQQRGTGHVGYQVHYTETIAARLEPQLITEVTTTPAPIPDSQVTPIIQQKLADKELAPEIQFVDAGYFNVANLVSSQEQHGITLYGPPRADTSWQNRQPDAFDLSCFQIDWASKIVTCPQGQPSISWRPKMSKYGQPTFHIRFSTHVCSPCLSRSRCTHAPSRTLTLLPQKEYEALYAARQRQKTPAFKERYRARAGVEALISHAANGLNSRRSRYVGLAKTHLHNVLTAVAINFSRVAYWLLKRPRARTRRSPLLTFRFA